jgi:hypothetical protein
MKMLESVVFEISWVLAHIALKTTLFTLGIDLGKTTFHLVGMNRRGEVALRRRFSRDAILLRQLRFCCGLPHHGNVYAI